MDATNPSAPQLCVAFHTLVNTCVALFVILFIIWVVLSWCYLTEIGVSFHPLKSIFARGIGTPIVREVKNMGKLGKKFKLGAKEYLIVYNDNTFSTQEEIDNTTYRTTFIVPKDIFLSNHDFWDTLGARNCLNKFEIVGDHYYTSPHMSKPCEYVINGYDCNTLDGTITTLYGNGVSLPVSCLKKEEVYYIDNETYRRAHDKFEVIFKKYNMNHKLHTKWSLNLTRILWRL